MSSTASILAPEREVPVSRPGVTVTDLLLVLMALIWGVNIAVVKYGTDHLAPLAYNGVRVAIAALALLAIAAADRKSTRLNSSHLVISYAVFCLKKKTIY